ncbi:MAG: outer membrane protein assembly factor BamE [Hyphomicrobiales bacterium]
MRHSDSKPAHAGRSGRARAAGAALALGAVIALAGCVTSETQQHGYVVSENSLEQVPVGSSREQVIIVLGSPSTTATIGNEIFYYISQKRVRNAAFMNAKVVDQRVVAVYFDKDSRVERIADYGLKDGKVFDFISRQTATSGKDLNFLSQILQGLGRGTPFS